MPFDRDFATALINAMAMDNWKTDLAQGELPNPLFATFTKDEISKNLIIHARRITRQARLGSSPSTHNRPPGEMHAQMIFDGDKRGAGNRNKLRFDEHADTLLFGFTLMPSFGYIVAAYDPQKHAEYAYSKSLQIRSATIEQAANLGIAFQTRQSDETIVAFHINEIAQYLDYAPQFHTLSANQVINLITSEAAPPVIKRVLRRLTHPDHLPQLAAETRKQEFVEVGRYIRNRQFASAITSVYERCAICGFQYDFVLEAAHIVPVADGGTDTYDNGLGLCPNCHYMFDNSLILVDESYQIFINPHRAEIYENMGRADSLEDLRARLRKLLWLPEKTLYHPNPENLRRTFFKRRQS